MKKLILMFILLSGLMIMVGFKANASETTTTEEVTESSKLPNAGTKPGNFLYGFDKFFENISLKLTFSDEKKVEKLSRFAEERLAELNELNPEAAEKYADELFNEYGLDMEKAHLYVQKLVAEGKLSDAKLSRIENRVLKVELKQEQLKDKAQERISEEVKSQVHEAIRNAKMSIFNKFTDVELIQQLHDEGYGYGQLLKLQAISELTSISISDLLLIEGAVSTEDDEKQINIETILEAHGITLEQLHEKLKEYRDSAKEEMKGKFEQAKKQAEERKNEIKENRKNRKNG